MENPHTWGKVEWTIHEALGTAHENRQRGLIGLSETRVVANALREAGLIHEEDTMSTRKALIGGAAAFLLGCLVAVLVFMAVFGWPG